MRRRDTLRKCAVLGATGGLGLLAGCSGGGDGGGETTTESASLSKESFDYEEGDSGNLVVTVTVTNDGTSEGTGYVYVTMTAAESATATENGGQIDTVASRKSTEVTVPAGESRTVRIEFDVTFEQFGRRGSIEVDFRA